MSKKTDPKPKSKEAPAEKRTGNAEQRNPTTHCRPWKRALRFEVLSDLGQKVERAFGLVYEVPPKSSSRPTTASIWIFRPAMGRQQRALPVSATYVIDRDGSIIYAYTDVDYRDRADPRDVLQVLTKTAVAA